ncbi:MAG: hypothetical protein ABR511_01345 [Acidimicrobiales bacterium]
MSTRTGRRRSSAMLIVAGFVLAAAGAAFAFWTVNVLFAPTNYALAQANSLSAATTPTATANDSAAITVGWTLPATQLPGAQYRVTRTSGPGSPLTVCSVSSTSCQDTGLTGGTAYGYSVAAVLQNWQSPGVTTSATTPKASQTIAFTSTAPSNAAVGGSTYTVTATSSSGLTVAFSLDGTSTGCSLAGSTVSFTAVGTCVIDANQAGNANYNAAPQVQQSFAVAKGAQTITFTSTAPGSATVGGPTYTVTATSSSGLTVVITSATTSVCTVSGSTVSFVGAGTCTLNANQAGDAKYNAASQAQQSFAVAKGSQTITFTSTAPGSATVGEPTYTVTATSSSGLTVAITSATTSVCTISGSTVSFVGAGTCTLNANQAGDANYNAAPQVQQSFAVAKGSQTITFTSTAPTNATVGGPTYTVTATSSSGLTVAFSLDGTSTGCSLAGSTVSFTAVGTCRIDANQAGNANYNAAPQVQQSFTVRPSIASVTLQNGGSTQGRIEAGDKIVITFSQRMRVSSFCSAWTGDTANQGVTGNGDVTVTLADGGAANDTMTVGVAGSVCPTWNFGTIDLGATSYVSGGQATFNGSGNGKSTIDWNATTFTLTVTLGSKAGSGTVGTVTSSTPVLNLSTAITDPTGLSVGNSPFTLPNGKQF